MKCFKDRVNSFILWYRKKGDFLLKISEISEKVKNKEVIYKLFIKPKGDHLIHHVSWKKEFLAEIEKEAKIELYQNQQFKLIGMPFYYERAEAGKKKDAFDLKLKSL